MRQQVFSKALMIVIVIVSLSIIMGCNSKDEKAAKKIAEALQEKYGKEFVVDSLGGGWGTMNSNTLKAIVYPKDDMTMKVFVEITKDLKQVYDDYLNEMVAKAAEQPILEMAERIWGPHKIEVTNDTGMVYPEHTNTSMSYEQFLSLYPNNWQLLNVYVNGDTYIDDLGRIDESAEIERYRAFADLLKESKYVRSSVTVWYLTSEAYDRFEEAKKSDSTVVLYYNEAEKKESKPLIRTAIGFDMDHEGQIQETNEQFAEQFKVWEQKRSQK